MDLVSRLKKYLDYRQISVTQFADECGIPRPTASQLLAGRNKKVSDEIIGRIHQTYPALSVLWLMFGEGDMLSSGVPEKELTVAKPEFTDANATKEDTDKPKFENVNANRQNQSEFRFTDEDKERETLPESEAYSQTKTFDFANTNSNANFNSKETSNDDDTYTLKTVNGKKVIGIVVYYDDNTFESFIPDPEHRHPFLK